MISPTHGFLDAPDEPAPILLINSRIFPEVPLTAEEKLNIRMWSQYTKFQTSTYIAYIHETDLPYITVEHLERPGESVAMQRARELTWGKPLDREKYKLAGKHPYEESLVTDEWHELDRMWMEDHREKFPELASEYDKLSDKYTFSNYIWENSFAQAGYISLKEAGYYTLTNMDKVAAVSSIALSAVNGPPKYTALTFFSCFRRLYPF